MLIGKCLIVEIEIVDMVIFCLLDIGLMVSMISELFYNKYLSNIFIVWEKFIIFCVVNGLEILYVGYIECEIFMWFINKRLDGMGIFIVKDI